MMPKIILATSGTSRIPEFAGSTWVRLQYLLGFQRLGFDVHWVDRIGSIDVSIYPHSLDYLMEKFRQLALQFGFGDRYCVIYNNGERYFGMSEERLDAITSESALLINISGLRKKPPPTLLRIPKRIYVDVDPGFTQIWAHEFTLATDIYHYFFTVGQNVGSPDFHIPLLGVDWQTILPPVVLDHWPACIDEDSVSFSTVADWRSSQDAMFGDEYYGGKREEFIRMLRVPRDSGQRIELALCIDEADCEDLCLLVGNEWVVRSPYRYAGDVWSYREFIQRSRAEFSVAKRGYIKSRSGWISDRTACYLASGKPALVQSTGFEEHLPAGHGLLTFSTAEDAILGIAEINRNYADHARNARKIAEDYFDSDRILGGMLDRVGL
jgi:hypothetical protein